MKLKVALEDCAANTIQAHSSKQLKKVKPITIHQAYIINTQTRMMKKQKHVAGLMNISNP